ncbi:unnamed protein product [Closterium sp. Naga37s-1]|nr:unnamed protein product [Closterium sp. Naga37s-1]
MTLPEMMKEMGHTYVDVFKIDCEGCEVEMVKDMWAAYQNTGNKLALHGGNLPFGQILIELHNMNSAPISLETFYTLEKLGYRMFSIEYNPYCPMCEFNGALQPMLGNPVRMKELILVPTYTCPLNERIGKWGDGGKWACMMPSVIQKKDPVVYSIGSFGMYSFEKEMHQMLRTMPYTFDPFLPPAKRNIMASLPFLHFIEIGLSGTASISTYRTKFPEKKFATLPEMMGQFGHSYVDVFKIDCEGCEVEWIKDLGQLYNNTGKRLAVHGGKLPFGQILIEFHNMDKSVKTLTMVYTLENLGYRMFSIEYNHRCAVCCEMSFIHESLVRPDSATDCRPFLAPPLEDKLEVEVVTEGGGTGDDGAAAGDGDGAAADGDSTGDGVGDVDGAAAAAAVAAESTGGAVDEKEKVGEDTEEEETASEKTGGNRKVKFGGEGKEEGSRKGSSKGISKVISKGSAMGSTKEKSTKVGKKIKKAKSSKTSKKEIKEEEEE